MSGLTGTARLTRLALRRDRFVLPAWVVGIAVFAGITTALIAASFPTRADLVQDTELVASNPGMRMLGLVPGTSFGAYTMHRDFVTLAVLAALMSALAVVRHTRQNEELGRAEMVGAGVVGRYAGLAAAVLVTVAANVALALLVALALVAGGRPAPGSFVAGAAVAGVGLAFTGVAVVTAQLTSTSRGATGLAGALVGVAFLLSGIGNVLGTVESRPLRVTSAWPAWLSPVGWGQQMRPFGDDAWWPLVLPLVLLGCLCGVGAVLVSRRDVGSGMWRQRRGEAHAARALLSPAGLVLRLQRGALLGWAVGVLGFGLVFGSLSDQVADLEGAARQYYLEMGGTSRLLDAYQTSMIQMAGMAVAIYVVQILLRMRTDEAGGTLEPLLATGVTRLRWTVGYGANALTGSVVLLLVFGVGMGATTGRVTGDTAGQVGRLSAAALAQLPGVLVAGAAVVAVVGLLPRWAVPLSWALLIGALMVGPLFGSTLGLPGWVQDLSPFTHVPKAPANGIAAAPLAGLVGAGIVLAVAGTLALRRRSLALPA